MMLRKTITGYHYFTPTSFFHVQSSELSSSCFLVILFHCCCSNAQVLRTTFAHEFHIPIAIQNVTCFCHETRWSLLIGRRFACQKQIIIIITNSSRKDIFFLPGILSSELASLQSVFELYLYG